MYGSPDSRIWGACASAANAYARLIASTSGADRYLPTSSNRSWGLRAALVEAVAMIVLRERKERPGLRVYNRGRDVRVPSRRKVSNAITFAAATRSETATCSSG